MFQKFKVKLDVKRSIMFQKVSQVKMDVKRSKTTVFNNFAKNNTFQNFIPLPGTKSRWTSNGVFNKFQKHIGKDSAKGSNTVQFA